MGQWPDRENIRWKGIEKAHKKESVAHLLPRNKVLNESTDRMGEEFGKGSDFKSAEFVEDSEWSDLSWKPLAKCICIPKSHKFNFSGNLEKHILLVLYA